MKSYKLMTMATLLAAAALMLTSGCKKDKEANAVFYQTEADAQKWELDFTQALKEIATQLGSTITDKDVDDVLSSTTLEFYVDGQKLSKTIAVNYCVKNEAALNCDVVDFPTFTMNLGKDKQHTCALKVNLKDDNQIMATGNMTVTIEADKCNMVRFPYDELEKSLELNEDYLIQLITALLGL
ncbi:MAG: hypothetical protein IJU72_10805 [Bacteroidales bacterium]|nr:hypothetical protein [Bacteroidales bacterium]